MALHAALALAEVIAEIAIERLDSAARARLRLTGPVHYIRDNSSGKARSSTYLMQRPVGTF